MNKKILFLSLLAVSVFLILITGCSEKKAAEFKTGRYVVSENDVLLSPKIILNDNNEYMFIKSPYISFLTIGKYSIEDNKLTLYEGESKTYIFTIDGENLIFENDDDLFPKGIVFKFYDDEAFDTDINVTYVDMVKPSIMVDNELFYYTGEPLPVEPAEEAIKKIASVVLTTDTPSRNGEINMPYPDTEYAKIEDYVVVLIDHEWVKFERK